MSQDQLNIIHLLTSGDPNNISLGYELALSQGVDISDFLFMMERIQQHNYEPNSDIKQVLLEQKIDLNDSATSYLERVVACFPQLKELSILNCKQPLDIVSIAHCTQLKELSIRFCPKIMALPSSFSKLVNLETLVLHNTPIANLPDTMQQLNLKKILSYQCNFAKIPSAVFHYKELSLLQISHNKLSKIPETIADLTALKRIDVCHNQIAQIPDNLFVLPNLTDVLLDENPITDIPETIDNCTNLNLLQLNKTLIHRLPESIINLANLSILAINHCPNLDIEHTAAIIRQLPNIKVVYLSAPPPKAMELRQFFRQCNKQVLVNGAN